MENFGSSTSQGLNLQVEEQFNKNFNVSSEHDSSKNFLDVKTKRPIPSPRFLHKNELENKSNLENTRDVKKLSKQLSIESNSSIQSQNSNDFSETLKSPTTLRENDDVTNRRPSSIYNSLKRLFVSKRHRKYKLGQPFSPTTPESAGAFKTADFQFNSTVDSVTSEDLENDDFFESNQPMVQRQLHDVSKRVNRTFSARLAGATAPMFDMFEDEEEELIYENVDFAMEAHLSKFFFGN